MTIKELRELFKRIPRKAIILDDHQRPINIKIKGLSYNPQTKEWTVTIVQKETATLAPRRERSDDREG